ncbi:Detected protein of confused Function [Hibiscus syriacus]|uniref:Detected protein of confused Function n=1 Tax=Hibiscus syriacus TaxID=106335 RepID=A0A6A2ZR39_HIBSY|nr:Detected protein of confused Function [Hibiscus syriacus]
MNSDERPQQVTGVVIITLPPSDNPSYGKTITAFTLSNDDVLPQSLRTQKPDQNLPTTHVVTSPPPSPQNPQHGFSFSRLFSDNPRRLLGFLGISLFALLFCSSSFSNTSVELRNSNDSDNEKPRSFIFPLYHKLGAADTELKLGRFVDVDNENLVVSIDSVPMGTRKVNKLVGATAAVIHPSATTILPVRGNVYPDGRPAL